MIDRQYQNMVFAFLMALLMSCCMSFALTVFNLGWQHELWHAWIKAWSFAFVVAFPTIQVVAPIVRKLVGVLIK